jgi:hypothetical protein
MAIFLMEMTNQSNGDWMIFREQHLMLGIERLVEFRKRPPTRIICSQSMKAFNFVSAEE